jgi:hypothetical protein
VNEACVFSIKLFKVNTELYGSVTTSDTIPLVDPGRTEKVNESLSLYSSDSFSRIRDPRPAPVPPPMEWVSWNACSASQSSASFLTLSRISSISSAPSVQ